METLNALKILNGIHSQMKPEDILRLVIAAKKELILKDTTQVAAELGVSKVAVYKRAAYRNVGFLIAPRARVYSPSDIEKLRLLISKYRGQRPETVDMIEKMKVLRKEGQTLDTIGKAFGKTESYVSKLLKDA